MARILRGEIRWADLNPVRGREQAGLRPVLILSQDVFNERSGTVIAMAITSQPQRAGFPLTLESKSAGLPKQSWLKIGQVRTLAVERIGKKISYVPPEELAQAIEGLNGKTTQAKHWQFRNSAVPYLTSPHPTHYHNGRRGFVAQ